MSHLYGTSIENQPGAIAHHTVNHELKESHSSLGFANPAQWNEQYLSTLKVFTHCLQEVSDLWKAAINSVCIRCFSIAPKSKAHFILALTPLAPSLWSQVQQPPPSLLMWILHRGSNPTQTSPSKAKSWRALISITGYITRNILLPAKKVLWSHSLLEGPLGLSRWCWRKRHVSAFPSTVRARCPLVQVPW